MSPAAASQHNVTACREAGLRLVGRGRAPLPWTIRSAARGAAARHDIPYADALRAVSEGVTGSHP